MSAKKYYLKVNGNTIIKMDDYKKYGDMTNFVSLCLFTSDFDSIQDIGEELKRVGLLNAATHIETIEIVRQYKGNYYFGVRTPLLKKDLLYFNVKTIKDFFAKNKYYYDEMNILLKQCKNNLENNIVRIEHDNIESPRLLSMLYERLANIKRLEVLIDGLKESKIYLYSEYREGLNTLVNDSIFHNGRENSINYLGLLDMAKVVRFMLANFKSLAVPYIDYSPKISLINESEDDALDPDEYMFLEESDYNYKDETKKKRL